MENWTLKPLEYSQVKEMLKQYTSSTLGKEKVEQITPSADYQEVQNRLQATAEGFDLIRLKGDVSLGGIRDIRASLRRARVGGMLYEMELLDVASTIRAGRKSKSLLKQIDEERAALPVLRSLTEKIIPCDTLEERILYCIDEQGMVVNHASPVLAKIRHEMDRIKQQITNTLQQIIRNPHYQKMMQEQIITQRYDRYVIPIKQEYRGAFGGIVHDQSSSGATLFIEPEAVVQLNNKLKECELKERKEVERILQELTNLVAEAADALEQNVTILAELDFILAKARFGNAMKAVVPVLSTERKLRLKQARHPLIHPEQVVPIDVEMGESYQAIIITGPNTGGKTVSLKTIGLLALMAQSGFPIPAEEGSVIPVYSGVFADIGDEQSIEQNLSTFSGHLTNIIRILKQLDERSLVLFDELGAGTDPTEGAALATAILEHVIEKGCSVVATTHYSELKLFAHTHPRAINASVEFDVETLKPTYRLLIGVPGRSNAFAISKRLGLPESIIQVAKSHLSQDENRLEEMIAALTQERKTSEEERSKAERLRKEAEQLVRELKEKLQHWEEEKARLKEKARQEAQEIVRKAEREAEEVLKELREWAKKRPQEIKEHQLFEAKKRLSEAVPDVEYPEQIISQPQQDQPLEPGDEVFVPRFNQKGTVVESLGQDEYLVQLGILKMKLHHNELQKKASAGSSVTTKVMTSVQRKSVDVKPELDLRGKMVEDAIVEIDKYLDAAVLAGLKYVSLIHGKGTGALRTGVQNFLRNHRSVKSFRLGSHGEGGAGVTIVELK
ncbi:endonuclease MutS2 [Thermoflavimicrobium dichotomicum]|uniref:Endonuclease MutS2 n=1 Tax=Thermoflavimicrobium dichotomicum TaxID=46223 RepID=A0A1I3L712_9BACL|nr:endonuclease MutS2 [Thermoflavimicrobium dichotomicum]SFI80501.1 DNA mismatch repair protein MutS2 [Thermoflavimicrobium dichotomicum]